MIVEAEDASSREATEFIESRPAYDDETSPLKLEDRLIELAEHYDGAILVDSKEIFPYIKYSAADREARMNFNYRYGHDVRYYSDIEQKKLLPSTFTNAAGGKPQTGTRTSAFTSTARVLVDNSKSNVMKTTTFGRTGVGKVLTMYTDSKKDKVYIYEFFLYSENDISRLMHKPENQVAQDFYFNPDDRIVGIVRHYQTNLNPDVRHQLNQVLRSIANGTSLSISLRARLLDTVSDFDHRLKRNTPLETVLETCDISPYLKDGLRWALFGKTPSKHLTNTVNQLFKDGERNLKPAYSLPPELRQIRDCYEQMLKAQ